ncbi:MAG: NAAT family transporter [Alphaproteobacteria bacterium]|nr:NAAT family transporter [Alphaproteobacteria bacterium]TAD90281.1 MAG: NAAT family transporter [Alphaproteobacteria bacterium]
MTEGVILYSDYTRFLVALFAILTPFAALPMFVTMTEGATDRERAATARTACLTVAVVLVSASLTGDIVLTLLGTSLASFRVGGGLVLLLMALAMLSAKVSPVQQTEAERDAANTGGSVGVVPLGVPLLAGPGAISTVMLEGQRSLSLQHQALVWLCIAVACFLLYLSLRAAAPIGRTLGPIGLNIVNRLFGLLLAAIAVEMMASGLRALLPGLS